MAEPSDASDLDDGDYARLGRILERFIHQDGVTYWGVGLSNRPYNDGQEGGMTIDMSIEITRDEAALLDRVGEPW